MIIGVPLLKGNLNDGRCIFYLEENLRRKLQREGFIIKTFIPDNDYKFNAEDLDFVNGVYLPEGEYDKSIFKNIPIYGEDNFIENCKKRKINKNKKDKTIGIVAKYASMDDVSKLYIVDRVRRTMFLSGANIEFIIPVQDIDYPTTKGDEFDELTIEEKKLVDDIFSTIDGLLFPGGFKLTPYDRYLFEKAVNKDIPTLGICLGMQTMSCYKKEIDLRDINSSINHNQENDDDLSHSIIINRNSLLYKIIGSDKIMVNSFHKKMSTPNSYFNCVAFSDDIVIEAIEMPNKEFILGVQWHPEISYEFDDNSKKIIDYFVNLL